MSSRRSAPAPPTSAAGGSSAFSSGAFCGATVPVTSVARLKPYQYIHVLDNNTTVVRLLTGPQTYTRQDHESFVQSEPKVYVVVPSDHYCVIGDPVVRNAAGDLVFERPGQVKVRLGASEIRFAGAPFPLYPGESIVRDVTRLRIVKDNEALKVSAVRTFDEVQADGKSVKRAAGDEWYVNGPCTFIPSVDINEIELISATTILENEALQLRARYDFKDRSGVARRAGEQWLVDRPGSYLPSVEEEVVEKVVAQVLTNTAAIHVSAKQSFTDRFGKARLSGSQWLVTNQDCVTFIPSPYETVVQRVNLVVIAARQYAVVLDPVDASGRPQFGRRELRKGPCKFFFHPGESAEDGRVKDVHVLQADEALVLLAVESFKDHTGAARQAGERWMIRGPCEYTPPVQVQVAETRKAIPLDVTEGVYIRDKTTGHVRSHMGSTVMLTEFEELFEKPLDTLVEDLLSTPKLTKGAKDEPAARKRRVGSRVVTCNVPHNAVVQVYDFRRKTARVIRGPELVALGPDEEFTVVSLSGGTPKSADQIQTLSLNMGPDFMTDEIVVETSDHARLLLRLNYNWYFDCPAGQEAKMFSVPDFVGDATKAIASRIRGAVASEPFDRFHLHSSTIIRFAVFGDDKEMRFPSNGLVVTNVDIHSVDPVDPKTREALTKSVQLAIEITTKSQEASARHQASQLEQDARGRLERQVIADRAGAEEQRKGLLTIEATNAAIESTGASKAQSQARRDAAEIEGKLEVELASRRASAERIMFDAELSVLKQKQAAQLAHKKALNDLETARLRALAAIEIDKFAKTIRAVGKETIKAIARSGPETQVKLLKALGLQGYLVTDGTSPINLFSTAKGMAAAAGKPPAM